MSYDLAVFDPAVSPASRTEFVLWFKQQTQWGESHGYNDPEVPSSLLRAWFHETIETYPPMNGPLASDDPDDLKVTDYSLGRGLIYAAFAWSQSEGAHAHVRAVAAKHGVGFADVSGDSFAIWLPSDGTLVAMP